MPRENPAVLLPSLELLGSSFSSQENLRAEVNSAKFFAIITENNKFSVIIVYIDQNFYFCIIIIIYFIFC